MKDDKAEVQDPLVKVNLGTKDNSRLIFISALLKKDVKKELIVLLTSHEDYFVWDYYELPGLDKDLDFPWLTSFSLGIIRQWP